MDEEELTSSHSVDLPVIAIHRILSLLAPDDAIRASTVCRQWRSAWTSSPKLAFDEKHCPLKGSNFFDYVDASIALWRDRCDGRVNLEMLSISAAIDDENLADRLQNIFAFATSRNVKSVELENQAMQYWRIPSSSNLWTLLFDCKSLEALSLSGTQFSALNPLPSKFESVKKLSLSINHLNDFALSDLISYFPSLEDLYLGFCENLHQIRILSPSLKKFVILLCEHGDTETVMIEAPSLQCFHYTAVFGLPGSIQFSNCKSLTSLTFDRVRFKNENVKKYVGDCISQIPLLEDLAFKQCKFNGRIDISHDHLKKLNLKTSYGFKRAVIDTPNLCYFKYSGGVFHFELFKFRIGFLQADIGLVTGSFDETEWFWFVRVRNFLENFSKCSLMLLECYVKGFPNAFRDYDFLPDPFDTIVHLTLTNDTLALEDCIHFVGAMVEIFPRTETLCLKTPFAIINIEYEESGTFTLTWVPTIGASNSEKYGTGYEFIRQVVDELMEFLSDDMKEDDDMDEH